MRWLKATLQTHKPTNSAGVDGVTSKEMGSASLIFMFNSKEKENKHEFANPVNPIRGLFPKIYHQP
jgi:hypothetical protein